MKKILVTALAIGTLGFFACSDDKDEDSLSCAEIEQNIVEARVAYEQNPGDKEACLALSTALQAYLDEACETKFSPTEIEAELGALNCDEL